jgi:hypothetical protein
VSKVSLWGKGTKGRDASPKTRPLMSEAKPPKGVGYTGVGTPMGGKPPEAGKGGAASGVIDPSMYNVDLHAVRAMSRYWEGKRAGPDWLHKRVEAAEDRRRAESDGMLRGS